MRWVKKLLFFSFLNKGLINVYTTRDIKHRNDRQHGIVNNNAALNISKLFSFLVQTLFIDQPSL